MWGFSKSKNDSPKAQNSPKVLYSMVFGPYNSPLYNPPLRSLDSCGGSPSPKMIPLRLKIAQKPCIVWSLGPKALYYESLEPSGKGPFRGFRV